MCEEKQETFEHFMKCNEYGENSQSEWTDIFGNDTEKQKTIAEEVRKRTKMRKRRQEAARTPHQAPILQLLLLRSSRINIDR